MYKRIINEASNCKDIRVFEPITTNYLEAELINYELEDVIKAIKHVFNVNLIKEGPRNE